MARYVRIALRGKAAFYQAVYPDGRRESLLDVPAYDFNWQTNYVLKEPKMLPAGTRIEVKMVYDNSAENAERVGFNPAREVRNGGPTTDEMAIGFIDYCLTEPIDTASGGE